ncbi:MAG TPA: ECF-type sigma factor [Burkholderiaceae bacterium]
MGEVTQLIARAREGDRPSLDRLFEVLYPELRRIAHRRLWHGGRGGAFETTALVNECYLKFVQRDGLGASDRAHFLAYAAAVMRSVIVDAARSARADRRGGDLQHVTLDTAAGAAAAESFAADELLDIHAALEDLQRIDPRLVQVVEMRFFAGMTDAEIAQVLGLTDRTVRRDWEKARLLLAHSLRG